MLQKLTEITDAIQKEDWYKLSNGSISQIRQGQMRQRGSIYATHDVYISLTYRETSIDIDISANDKTKTFSVRTDNVRLVKRTKSAAKVTVLINEVIAEAITNTDANIVQIQAREETARLQEEQQEDIIKKIKQPVKKHEYQVNTLTFVMSKQYQLNFDYNGKPGKEVFHMCSIYGSFSLTQIEKFINCLTECPEAVADRLLNGK